MSRTPHFTAAQLLLNGWVVDSKSLTRGQRRALNSRARDPNSLVVKELGRRNGKATTVWRVIGAAHPKES